MQTTRAYRGSSISRLKTRPSISSGTSACTVVSHTTPKTVRLEPTHARFIAPFLGRERLVAEVAQEIGAPLSTTFRHVTRYCEAGILKVTREQARKGRALKLYRTVADAFFIPNSLRLTSHDAWLGKLEQAAKRGLEHVYGEHLADWGELVFRNEAGIFATSLAKTPGQPVTSLEPDAPAMLTTAHDAIYLAFADAKRLQYDLHALLETYAAKRGAQRYLLRLSLVPLPEDVELILWRQTVLLGQRSLSGQTAHSGVRAKHTRRP